MIGAVLIRFENVIARVAPSLTEYIDDLVSPVSFDFPAAVGDYYAAKRPWVSFIDERLGAAGVPGDRILDIAERTQTALCRPEAWRVFDDVPLALDWLGQRDIPTTIVSDWPVDMGQVLNHFGIRTNATFLFREGHFSDVVAHEASRLRLGADELLYVAAEYSSDYEDARSAGCYALVMDREDQFDETVPNINHLIEVELHI